MSYEPLDVTQYTVLELRAAVEAAENWGTYVTGHAYTPRAVRQAIEAGVKCIATRFPIRILLWLAEGSSWAETEQNQILVSQSQPCLTNVNPDES